MRNIITMIGLRISTVSLAWLLVVATGLAQDYAGNGDLDEAFDQKIKAQSTRDLENVVKLCKSAIEKGLDEDGVAQAKKLAASASMEHAEQLARRIFGQSPPDPRWQKFRSEAISRLEQATEFQPDMVAGWLMIARLNVELPNGNHEAARAAIDKAIENAGEDRNQLSSALLFRARISEDKESQLADINQAIKINPENLDAIRFRSVFHFSNNEPQKGLEDMNVWLSAETVTPDQFIESIVLLRALGEKFDEELQTEALEMIERGIQLAPDDIRFYDQKVQIHILRNELEQAVASINRLIELDQEKNGKSGNYYNFLLLRAQLQSSQDNWDEAIADCDEILEANPDTTVMRIRASALAGKGDFAEAIKELQKIQRRTGAGDISLKRRIGLLHTAIDEPSKAIKIYDEVLEFLDQREKELDNPSEEVQRGINLERQETWRFRGDAWLSVGEHQKAVEDYERVLESHNTLQELVKESGGELPDDEHTLNNFAWLLATSTIDELRDGQRAVELATRAAEVTEYKEAYILSTLASGYAETGDFETAIKWMTKAIEINEEEIAKKETEQNLKRRDSLQKEHESYLRNEPWREMENVEKEKAEREKAEQEKAESEKAESEKAENEKAENEKAENEKAENEKAEEPQQEEDSDESKGGESK